MHNEKDSLLVAGCMAVIVGLRRTAGGYPGKRNHHNRDHHEWYGDNYHWHIAVYRPAERYHDRYGFDDHHDDSGSSTAVRWDNDHHDNNDRSTYHNDYAAGRTDRRGTGGVGGVHHQSGFPVRSRTFG